MEIWFWLLIAAAFGGAIGWALHMLYLKRQADAAGGRGPRRPSFHGWSRERRPEDR